MISPTLLPERTRQALGTLGRDIEQEHLRLGQAVRGGVGLVGLGEVERVHDALGEATRARRVELVRPVIEGEEEVHEVGADAQLVERAVDVAPAAEETGVEGQELGALLLREVGHAEEPFL